MHLRAFSYVVLYAVFALMCQVALAHERFYLATLSGPAESPSNGSLGVGSVLITLDLDLFTMQVEAEFSDLTGTVTAAHIHGNTSMPLQGTADVMTIVPSFPNFPLGVNAGSYNETFDMAQASSYNPSFIAASGGTISLASNALIFGMEGGTTYFNIHTTAYGGGEIRGFLLPDPKADFNHDGIVDGDDLAIWQGSLGVDAEGDANDSEDTEGTDFLIWQRQQGAIAGIGGSPAIAVPEPACIQLLLVTALVMYRRNSGKRMTEVLANNGCGLPAEG